MVGKRTKARGQQPSRPRFVSDDIPLYYQLASVLRDKIIAGVYPSGSKIPTEAALVEEYELSRITVRQALSNLEEENLIRREPGRGTFVTDGPAVPDKLIVAGSIEDLISMGQATSVKLIDVDTVAPSPSDIEAMELDEGASLTRVTRLRLYHGEPYSYIENCLPPDIGEKLTRSYLKKGSILKFIEDELSIRLRDAEQNVRASLADAKLASLLDTRVGAPLLSVDRLVRAEDGRVVQRVHTFYRSDVFSFALHLTRSPSRSRKATRWSVKNRSAG